MIRCDLRRVRLLAWKELIQLRRDPILARMVLLMPVVQILILGSAISRDVNHVPLVIGDYAHTPESRQLAAAFRTGDFFDVVGYEPRAENLGEWLDSGRARMALAIPAAADGPGGTPRELQLLVSGEDPTTASIGSGYAQAIVAGWWRARIAERVPQSLATAVPNAPRARVLFNPDLESRNYMVPGIAVILLMMVTMTLTALGIVREREIGTLEQLLVTPYRAHELMLGKILPFLVTGLIVFGGALAAGWVVYRFPFHGNPLVLLLFAFLFALTMLGAGILVSTFARTQQQALFLTWFLLVFFLMMAGFLFPIENMPRFMQRLTLVDPVRYFMFALRAVLLKGAGLALLWSEAAILGGFAIVVMTIASWRFRDALR